jgi:hypothetical protein
MVTGSRSDNADLWTGLALVAAGLVLLMVVVLTPHNNTMPFPGTANAWPITAQPMEPTTPFEAPLGPG